MGPLQTAFVHRRRAGGLVADPPARECHYHMRSRRCRMRYGRPVNSFHDHVETPVGLDPHQCDRGAVGVEDDDLPEQGFRRSVRAPASPVVPPIEAKELPPKKVAWLQPGQLVRTAYHVWLSTIASEYLDRRETLA